MSSASLPPDILPLDQCQQRRQTANTLPPDGHQQCRQDTSHIIHIRYDSLKSHYHWWSQAATRLLTTFKRHLHNCLLQPDVPDTKCPLSDTPGHWSRGVAYDPVFDIRDWVSCHVYVVYLSYCLNNDFIYNILLDSFTVWTTPSSACIILFWCYFSHLLS